MKKKAIAQLLLGPKEGVKETLSGLVTRAQASIGPNHLETLETSFYLAMHLFNQKEYAASEKIFLDVINGLEAKLGPHHQEALQARHSYAYTLTEQGNVKAALKIERQVAQIR